MNTSSIKFFRTNILHYYRQHKRNLPWRDITDPYKIWISEIILQQTQVKQGLSYYLKFIQKFPDIYTLACSTQDEILHLWQGLGYYSRARNMHKAAQQVITEYHGQFPDTYEKLLTLKGIGKYTAAAIASFAYNLPYAVVDGNVYRVLSRYFGIEIPIDTTEGKNFFSEFAQKILDKKHPSEYNQAIMEFGATYCKPQNPDCPNCLLSQYCKAFHQNKVNHLPIKSRNIKKKNRYFNYFIFLQSNQYTYIQKRQINDIWKGLYEFYLEESNDTLMNTNSIQTLLKNYSISFKTIDISSMHKHILTHQNLFIQFIKVDIKYLPSQFHLKKVLINRIEQYPFPIIIQKHLSQIFS